jgi:hypothetical protein
MEWITNILNALGSVEGMSATLIVVSEFVFRLLPTKKPLSVLSVVAKVFNGLGAIFSKAGSLLDKILPQNSEEKQ